MTTRPFAVFDIDGTLIRWQLYHAIVNELALAGAIPASRLKKIELARTAWKNRGGDESFGDYELALVHTFHDALTSIPVTSFEQAVQLAFDKHKDQVYTYTRDLLRTLKKQGYLLFAISGSHQEIVDKLGAYYGFDAVIGARYEHDATSFTGSRRSPVDIGKSDLLLDLIEQFSTGFEGSVAVGDTRSDISILELVEQPIAFNPNKDLFAHATEEGWTIVVERKNMTYTLEQHGNTYVLV